MPDAIIDGTGITGSSMKVEGDGSINTNSSLVGLSANEILRLNSGSPAVDYVFSSPTNSVMVDNIGSDNAFFKFDGTADIGSTSGFLPAGEARSFDVEIGSVSVLGSGTSTPVIQVFRLS